MTEFWNGSAWSELNNLNTAGAYMAGGGSSTSALCGVGGNRPAQNESWNGTCWSEIAEQNTFRDQGGGAADSNTAGIIYGGEGPPVTAKTESWDGSSWSEVADMATARSMGSGGTGGQSGGPTSVLSGYPGDVWVVGNNSDGDAWIEKVSGVSKTKEQAQAIVDTIVESAKVAWDLESDDYKALNSRPTDIILP